MTINAYPLTWPRGWPRTDAHHRERSRFNTTPDRARRGLLEEIARLVGRQHYDRDSVIISSDVKLRIDGEPYAGVRPPEDPGVAVYFEYDGRPMVFACDRWDLVHDNIHSIGKTIEALRGIERWGASDMLERAFTGFVELPAPDQAGTPRWNEVLQIGRPDMCDLAECERNYQILARDYHPDRGGSHEQMVVLNWAIKQARDYYGGKDVQR